jgi:hypothetical protein
MHAYPSADGLLCSSLKKIIIGVPILFSKFLRKAFKKYRNFCLREACLFICPIYNGHMLDEIKNLKDSTSTPNIAIKDSSISMSYTKTSKLISALYMVTDIMEKDEPLRNKLRTLGANIISDTYLLATPNPTKVRQLNLGTSNNMEHKIAEILSFLEISSAINLISEMNYNILKKEFLALDKSIQEYVQQSSTNHPTTLADFFLEESKGHQQIFTTHKGHPVENKGHAMARIGVQKGSTLLKALSDKTSHISYGAVSSGAYNDNDFYTLKKERREEIISIVKNNSGVGELGIRGITITDIKKKATGPVASCGEKTIQRELISMVKDNLLNKTGEKRWSRYYIPN